MAQDFTLRLDAAGNEIDDSGNIVEVGGPVVSLRVNAAPLKKRKNPYLSHFRGVGNSSKMGGRGDDMMSTLGSRVVGAENMHRIPEFMDATDADDGNHSTSRAAVVDDRIPGNKSRLQRGRKAFRFHEQGIFVKQNDGTFIRISVWWSRAENCQIRNIEL